MIEDEFTMKDLSFISYLANRKGKVVMSDIEGKSLEELSRLAKALEYFKDLNNVI